VADHTSQIIDRIYEAAVIPDLWPRVLADLTVIGEGAFASLFVLQDGALRWVGTPEAETLIGAYVALGQPDLNTRIPRRMRIANPGFCTDLDVFTQEEIYREPFYRDFLHPRGYGWVAATNVTPPTGEMLSVSIERHLTRGPFETEFIERLDSFGPHLSRASLLAARLGLERARAMGDALGAIGLPAAVLKFNGRLLAANKHFESLMPSIARDRPARLSWTSHSADKLFTEAIAGLATDQLNETVKSIPIAAFGGHPPMIVHLLPICGTAHDVFSQASAIVIVTPVVPSKVPAAAVLQGLFDLTPAEGRVARGIGNGQTIEAIAGHSNVSRETVKSQLKSVLAKTGMGRQVELANLLAGLAVPKDR